jgi:hypothetical protein
MKEVSTFFRHTADPDAVRAHTSPVCLAQIDQAIENSVRGHAGLEPEQLTQRIRELAREWDMERYLEANASTLAFAGVVLAALHDRRWLLLSGVVLPFLFQHAVQGWCPPIGLFRRLGVRTRTEIERERYALKALRGDFDRLGQTRQQGPEARATAALAAASA